MRIEILQLEMNPFLLFVLKFWTIKKNDYLLSFHLQLRVYLI